MNSKVCIDCGESKRLSEFPPAKKRSDGVGSYCRTCMGVRAKASYRKRAALKGKSVRETADVPIGFKRCPDCNVVKALEAFPNNKRSASGVATYCKPCHNARSEETRQRLYGGGRHYHLMRRYGIGAADVEALIEAQGGVCAICLEAAPVHVDHDHATGAVRGVLCFNCNGGLGQFRDRIDVMRKAIEYLEDTA